MSQVTINCDLMADGWNYDTCVSCRHFSSNTTKKGLTWRCSLNNKSAKEKRDFQMIWAINYLNYRGMDVDEDVIAVTYIGKRKRK